MALGHLVALTYSDRLLVRRHNVVVEVVQRSQAIERRTLVAVVSTWSEYTFL